MPEPASTTSASAGVTAVALLSLFPGVDASIILGAFSGSIVFVLSSNELTAAKKVGYLLASFIAGVLAAPMAAAILGGLLAALPGSIAVSPGVGALLAATLAVKTLLWLLDRKIGDLLDMWRGGRRGE